MGSLEEITRELAAVVDELNATASTDFAKRHELLTRRDELRRLADEYRSDFDENRSTVALERELAARRSQLEAIYKSGMDMVAQAGGGSRGGAHTSAAEGRLNLQIRKAQGAGDVRARIARLEELIAARAASESE